MKLNKPDQALILETLQTRDTTLHNIDAFTSYFFTHRIIDKKNNLWAQIAEVERIEQELMEELKVKAKDMGYKSVTIVRDRDTKQSVANGKILYAYFYSRSELNTTIPDELIKQEDHHEVIWSGASVPD